MRKVTLVLAVPTVDIPFISVQLTVFFVPADHDNNGASSALEFEWWVSMLSRLVAWRIVYSSHLVSQAMSS